jgi:hypothetical protein
MAASRELQVEAYDKITVTIPDMTTTAMEVELQPGAGAGQVQLLMITSDHYGSALSYRVNTNDDPIFSLDQPVLLVGAAVSLLDVSATPYPPPERLFFFNELGEDAKVTILVGRDATP